MKRRRNQAQRLRTAVEVLPRPTREAMLRGIDANEIIVGAYTDRKGGVCPMLAAHRCGGRTDFLAFARAWDRYTHAKRPRRATEHEVATLIAHLEGSLLGDPSADFERAIADHQSTARERREREAARVGWSWLWRDVRSRAEDREHEPA